MDRFYLRSVILAVFGLSTLNQLACQQNDAKIYADSPIKTAGIGCRDLFTKAIPFPKSPFKARIDNRESRLKLFSAGGAGVVLKDQSQAKVYKVVHSDDALDPNIKLNHRQIQLFQNAEDLFEKEKDLFVELASNEAAIGEFTKYLVPSRLVTINYDGKKFQAIEKDFISGPTMDEVYRLSPGLFKENLEFKRALDDFYKSYKEVLSRGHRVSDVRDANLIYDVDKGALFLIDGAYDGYISPDMLYPFYDFDEICSPNMWCKASYFSDPEFSDSN